MSYESLVRNLACEMGMRRAVRYGVVPYQVDQETSLDRDLLYQVVRAVERDPGNFRHDVLWFVWVAVPTDQSQSIYDEVDKVLLGVVLAVERGRGEKLSHKFVDGAVDQLVEIGKKYGLIESP